MRTRKLNAKAHEAALSFFKINQYPTIFHLVLEIDSSAKACEMLDCAAKWIAEAIPVSMEKLCVFGCVDAGGPEFFVKIDSNVLMTERIRVFAKVLPNSYPELGKKFDSLHPVLFGSKQLCYRIESVLKDIARVIPSSVLRDFAVLRLSPSCDMQSAQKLVSRWIV